MLQVESPATLPDMAELGGARTRVHWAILREMWSGGQTWAFRDGEDLVGIAGIYAERAVVEHLHLMGNALTTGGITIYNRDTSGNANWGNASRDVTLRDVMISEIGAGWALDCRAWELEAYGVTLGENLLKGARFGEEAQACRLYGTYITDCANEGLSIGATGIANNVQFFGLVAQQCGGSEGVIVFHSGEGNAIYGLYSEANNSKGASCLVNIKDGASAQIHGGSHKSGGSVVFKANGQNMMITGFESSNVSGNIVEVTNTDASGHVMGVDFIDPDTATGGVVNYSASAYLNSNVLWHKGKEVYGGQKIRGFAPYTDWIDESAGATDFRVHVDANTWNLQQNGSGSFANILQANPGASTPELVASARFRTTQYLMIADGVSAPANLAGYAAIYVDTADGDLKVRFGDGTIKTIVTDT